MPKFIQDESRKQYLKNVKNLQSKINPNKHTPEEREAIIKQMKKERGM